MKRLLPVVVIVMVLVGCDQPKHEPKPPQPVSTFRLPEGLPTDRTVIVEQETHGGGSTENVKSQGAGLQATGDKADLKGFNAGSPGARLTDGGSADGGDTAGNLSASLGGGKGWLYGGAVLALLAAGGCTFMALRNPLTARTWFRGAVVCGGIAGVLLACAVAPALAVFLLVGGAAAMVGAYLYEMRNHAAAKVEAANTAPLADTLRVVKKTIDQAPDAVRDGLKPLLSEKMDRAHKDVIKKL